MAESLSRFVSKRAGDRPLLRNVAEHLPDLPTNVGNTERLVCTAVGGLLAINGITGRRFNLVSTMLGGALLYRGLSGHCPMYQAMGVCSASDEHHGQATVIDAGNGVRVEDAVTINRLPAELYRFWRDLENLPRFMNHLREVRQSGPNRSHWIAKGPLGLTVEWEAEIIKDIPNRTISWRSLEGSDIDTAGSVHFREVTGTGSTEVRVNLKYDPPAGKLGAAVAWLFGSHPEHQIRHDLKHFKEMMESHSMASSQCPAPAR
jgi:uncharacterized membrane protein